MAVIAATVGFSTGFPIVKGIDLPAPALGMWRLGIGAAVLGALALRSRVALPVRWWPVIGAGLAFGAHQLVFIEATKLTAIAVVTLVGALQPLLVSLLSRRTVGEPVPRALLGWSALALSGVGLVVLSTAGDESRSLLGDVLAVVNLLAFTAYFLFSKRARVGGTAALSVTVWFMLVALLALTPVALLGGGAVLPPTATDASWLVVLAVIPGNGHLLVNWAHSRVSAALASIVLAGIPVLASLWGRIFYGEPFGVAHVIGLVCVVAAIHGARRVEMRQAPVPGAPAAG